MSPPQPQLKTNATKHSIACPIPSTTQIEPTIPKPPATSAFKIGNEFAKNDTLLFSVQSPAITPPTTNAISLPESDDATEDYLKDDQNEYFEKKIDLLERENQLLKDEISLLREQLKFEKEANNSNKRKLDDSLEKVGAGKYSKS